MASNGKSGDNRRHGAVKNRSQFYNSANSTFVKRNTENGQIMDVKQGKKFKGVRKEN
jgi:hypothetical protein